MKLFNFINPLWLCQNVFTLYGGKGGSAPAPPDYTGAANATAAGNLEAAKVASAANRVNQVTPYGGLTYTQNPNNSGGFDQAGYDAALKNYQSQMANYKPTNNNGLMGSVGLGNYNNFNNNNNAAPTAPDRNSFNIKGNGLDTYTATQTLNPAQQNILNSNNQLSQGFLNTANTALGQVGSAVQNGFDFNKLPQQQVNAGQTGQDAIMARLNPELDRQQEALRTQLANQGIPLNSQAYDQAMESFGRTRNDANQQAALSGIGIGNQARQQGIQEQEFGRTEPINIINALRTGNQVQNPSFINSPQQQTTAGPDLLGATNANYQNQLGSYNAQQARNSNGLGGLFGIAGSVLGGPAGGFGSQIASKFFG